MKKAQIGAAAMALLLAAGLTACAADDTGKTTNPTDTTAQQQQDSTPAVTEDPELPQEETPTEPEITVVDQPDRLTVAENDKYVYTLAQIGGITEDGEYLIQVLHDFEPGETIDFCGQDLSQWEATGEEFLLQPNEGLSYFVREDETWTNGKLSALRADDYVFLTQDAGSGEVYALTAAVPAADEPTDATVETPADDSLDSDVEGAADAASNANTTDEPEPDATEDAIDPEPDAGTTDQVVENETDSTDDAV